MKAIAGIIAGLIVATLGAILVAFVVTSSARSGMPGAVAFFALWIGSIVAAVMAPSAAKAWRRLLLTSAVLSFLLPLSGLVFTGSQVAGQLDKGGEYAGAAAAGAAIGGTLFSGFLGFVGFFLGVVFLVIGLLVGRDKQIVYVQSATTPPQQPSS